MTHAIATLLEIRNYLDEVSTWMLKSKVGLTREDAKRIFYRYRSGSGQPAEGENPPSPTTEPPENTGNRQAQQISQILGYMEQTSQRLDQIENDIGYIKERIDSILKRL